MYQIDEALIEHSLFLQPASFADKSLDQVSARHYRPYERILEEGAVVGVFNTRFRFVTDKALTNKYEHVARAIAEAMLKDHKHTDHKLFHIASMERGSLRVTYEWELRTAAALPKLDFDNALRLKHLYRVETLLVMRPDLPTYDVIAPNGLPEILASLPEGVSGTLPGQ